MFLCSKIYAMDDPSKADKPGKPLKPLESVS